MNLFDILRAECIVVGAAPTDKPAALRAIASAARTSPVLAHLDEEDLYQGLFERENLGSTGFGGGIAIPHCRLDGVEEFLVGILTAPEGVLFDALDEKPVRLFVFIVGPTRESNEHIHILSAISQVLTIPGAVDEIVAAQNADAARESFLRHARDEVDTNDPTSKKLLHVFVQDEEIFRSVLQVFAAVESSSSMVLDAQNMSAFLTKMPLFAGFWSDEARNFGHIIVSVVEASLVNETIRRIEQIAGTLTERRGVLVTVQDVFFAAGHLDA